MTPRRRRAAPILVGLGLVLAAMLAACGDHPDSVSHQFFDRMAALDGQGMAQLVCEDERAAFRERVDFLRAVSDGGVVGLEDFKARTEKTDGTEVTLSVSGRFVSAELGEISASGRVRLVRNAGEWCLSGEHDRFRSIDGIASDLFSLLIRGRISAGDRFEYPGSEWIVTKAITEPAGPPELSGEVVTTSSGLRYVEIEEGSGESPQIGHTVVVHYTMWLQATGELIDKTVEGEPKEFVIGSGEVLDGFDEGVATMREGGRRRITVPWRLGYKDDYVDGFQDNVLKNSTLTFDVELLEVR
jgi:peptidylprolyl isomerase